MRAPFLLVLVAVLLWPAAARAEYWMGRVGTEFKSATRLELIHLTEVKVGRATGKITRVIRGAGLVGASTTIDLLVNDAKAGDDLLLMCDSECPRAEGVDRGGWAIMTATQMMDGASLEPSIVELGSLDVLAAGKPAPDLCLRMRIRYLDEPKIVGVLGGKLTATMGEGKLAVSVTGTSGASTPMFVGHLEAAGREPGGPDTVQIMVSSDKGQQAFASGPLRRAKDRCFEADLSPSQPLARTPAGLTQHLGGKARRAVLGRGTITLDKPAPLASMAIELAVDDSGGLELVSDVFGGEHAKLGTYERGLTTLGLGFERGGQPSRSVFFRVAVTPLEVITLGAAAAVATALMRTGKLNLEILASDGQQPVHRIGTAELSYVAE